jgi:glutathione S-transferase
MAKDYRPLMYQRLIGPMLRLKYSLEEALAVAARSTDNPADLDWERRVWSLAVLTPAEQRQAEVRLYRWLDKVEAVLEGRDFLVGEHFSQAEISIYPRVAMYPYIGLQIPADRFPRTRAWMRRLESRPSFPRTQTPQDRAVLLLARIGLLPWIAREVARAPDRRSVSTRLGLSLLRLLLRLGTGMAVDRRPRPPLKKPKKGPVPPAAGVTHSFPIIAKTPAIDHLVLHEYARAPECARLRWLLTELGLPFSCREVDISRLAHKTPASLLLNPFGELPILEHGERVLYDSATIAEYLAGLVGDMQWFPRDALALAHVRMWLAFDAGMHKEFRPLFWLHCVRPVMLGRNVSPDALDTWIVADVDTSHVDWLHAVLRGQPRFDSNSEHARGILIARLYRLEQEFANRPWIAGEQLSFADIALFTRVALFPALGVNIDTKALPRLGDWMQRLGSRPGAKAINWMVGDMAR